VTAVPGWVARIARKGYTRTCFGGGRSAMSWWYVSNGERRGPVNEDELARLLSNGALAPNSLLWKSGMKGWEPAANITDLKSLLSSLPPEVPRDQPSRLQRLKRHLGSTLALIISPLLRIVNRHSAVRCGSSRVLSRTDRSSGPRTDRSRPRINRTANHPAIVVWACDR
jgi:GYF domain 2